jgi:hypothetical protein
MTSSMPVQFFALHRAWDADRGAYAAVTLSKEPGRIAIRRAQPTCGVRGITNCGPAGMPRPRSRELPHPRGSGVSVMVGRRLKPRLSLPLTSARCRSPRPRVITRPCSNNAELTGSAQEHASTSACALHGHQSPCSFQIVGTMPSRSMEEMPTTNETALRSPVVAFS